MPRRGGATFEARSSHRQAALTGGVHGSAILPGNAQTSRLFRMVAGIEKPAMPLDGKLKPEQIEAIRLWIEQGANWDAQGPSSATATTADLEKGHGVRRSAQILGVSEACTGELPDLRADIRSMHSS